MLTGNNILETKHTLPTTNGVKMSLWRAKSALYST